MSSRRSEPHHLAILDAVRQLSAASDLLDAAVAQHLNIHRTDLRCLDYLGRAGPSPAGKLADAVGLTTGALSIAVDRLTAAGYVRREADPADRRRVLVRLTRKAQRVTALYADLAAATGRIAAGYAESDLELVVQFLGAVSQALTERARRVAAGR